MAQVRQLLKWKSWGPPDPVLLVDCVTHVSTLQLIFTRALPLQNLPADETCIRPPASSLKCDRIPQYLQMENRWDFGKKRKQKSPGNAGCSPAGLQRLSLMDVIFSDLCKTDVPITGELFCICAPASQWRCLRPHCVPG